MMLEKKHPHTKTKIKRKTMLNNMSKTITSPPNQNNNMLIQIGYRNRRKQKFGFFYSTLHPFAIASPFQTRR